MIGKNFFTCGKMTREPNLEGKWWKKNCSKEEGFKFSQILIRVLCRERVHVLTSLHVFTVPSTKPYTYNTLMNICYHDYQLLCNAQSTSKGLLLSHNTRVRARTHDVLPLLQPLCSVRVHFPAQAFRECFIMEAAAAVKLCWFQGSESFRLPQGEGVQSKY